MMPVCYTKSASSEVWSARSAQVGGAPTPRADWLTMGVSLGKGQSMPRKNPGERAVYQKAYHAAHREQARTAGAAWDKANAEKVRSSKAKYRDVHPEKVRASGANYRATKPEKVRAKNDAWRKAHPEKGRIYAASWRAAHPEKARAVGIAYRRAANPEIARARNARRRARKIAAIVNDFTAAQWIEMQAAYGFQCVYCGRKMKRLTQDHLTPLSKGGDHTASNIVPACRSCNSRKATGKVLIPIQPLLLTIALPRILP